MSDDSAPPPAEDEDAFSRAFRERWGDLADRAARLDPERAPQSDPTAGPPVHRDPTTPISQSDTAAIPAPPQPAPPPPRAAPPPPAPAYGQPAAPVGHTGPPQSTAPRPGEPLPSYGPPPGLQAAGYGQAGPSAAALLIVSGVTMAFTMLFIGLPSLVVGAIAAGDSDPQAKARKLRIGWILYAVNWAFVVIGVVVLTVGLFVYVGTL